MADLGDISGLFVASVPDLDWLDLDEKEYQKLDRQPEQNLDTVPELDKVWSHSDDNVSNFVPNVERHPPLSQVRSATVPSDEILRVARLQLMRDPDPKRMMEHLLSKFGRGLVRQARSELVALAGERGLLGRYYVSASDFPGRHSGEDKATAEFLRRYAPQARFIKACGKCSDCAHNAANTNAVFHKQVVVDVPYTEELADRVERQQATRGRVLQASVGLSPKARIQRALLAGQAVVPRLSDSPKPIEDPSRYLRQAQEPKKIHLPVLATTTAQATRDSLAWQPPTPGGKAASANAAVNKTAVEVVKVLRNEFLKGRSASDTLRALKVSFRTEDLKSTRGSWEPIFREAGLYGTVYSTQDSFDDCQEGADFLARHASSVKGIVAGGRCGGCVHNKMGRCAVYDRALVTKAEDLYTPSVLAQVVREQRMAGRVGSDYLPQGSTIREAFRGVHRTASTVQKNSPIRAYQQAFTGGSIQHKTSSLTKRDIVKAAQRFLNEGLYGSDLLAALQSRFDPRDLQASTSELRDVVAEQGLQGVYYINPVAYEDYGKCDEGGRLHRARVVPYVKLGPKCGSCVFHREGRCSKYNKPLVVEPPYLNKAAQQRAVLGSGKSTTAPVEFTRKSIMLQIEASKLAQMEIGGSLEIELDAPRTEPVVAVQIGTGKVKL